ncbi:MAG: DUF1214 domain-containing protein [Candidatus Doudnabacteria bacterium]|nr:DUF1214 domain-containing protein [Candidatus Doudnabacteria bacterium]
MSKFYTYLMGIVGAVCASFLIRLFFFTDLSTRTLRSDILQGVLIGVGLAFVMAQVYGKIKGTKINGWTTMYGCGEPGNGMFLRAAHSWTFLGPINVPEEAMYWYTNSDGTGHTLDGRQNYIMHFPPGQLPPNDAFWSLTMGDAKNHFVPNPLNRYSVSDRTGLVPNADGSTDIYIQNTVPIDRESNWLPAPSGNFILWLRVYIPGAAILNRTYTVPPIVKTK